MTAAAAFTLLPLPAAAVGFYELTPREPLPAAYASAPCAGDWHGPAPWGTVPASPCAVGVTPAEVLAGQPFAAGVVGTASAAPQSAPLVPIVFAGGGGASAPVSPTSAPCCNGWTPGGDDRDGTPREAPATPVVTPQEPDPVSPSPVPLPASLPLLLAALGGVAAVRRAR